MAHHRENSDDPDGLDPILRRAGELCRRAARAIQRADQTHAATRDLLESIRADRKAKSDRAGVPPSPALLDVMVRICGEFGPPEPDGAWRWRRGLELRFDEHDHVPTAHLSGRSDAPGVDVEVRSGRELELFLNWLRDYGRV